MLRTYGQVLSLTTLLWPDELRQPDFDFLTNREAPAVQEQEQAMAEQFVASMTSERFLAAAVDGGVAGLEHLLAEDMVSWADGGGMATPSRRPLFGRAILVRLFVGMSRHPRAACAKMSIELVNGDPAIVVRVAGLLSNIIVVEVSGGKIAVVRTIANPETS